MTDLREAIKQGLGPLDLLIHCTDTDLLEIADAALAAIETAGWQCVPKEPTEEMIEALWGDGAERITYGTHYEEMLLAAEKISYGARYEGMLAAAPKPGGEK